ncbi:MAG: hypothetical protein K1X57_17850 [Gemmataceae bacterium]|nr:hypothetical protein [Gemmataceae bacterium]
MNSRVQRQRALRVEDFDGDPCHPILPDPYSWAMVEFTYRSHPTDLREAYIDLVFARSGVERRLRFLAPREVELPRGQMGGWCRVYVADVSARKLDDIRVRVGSFEPDWCVPSFWAASVVVVGE